MTYLTDEAGRDQAFICCGCGPAPVAEELLRRWEFDTPHFLGEIFRSIQLAVEERVAGHLWKVGKATWAGRSREIWFVRSFQRSTADAIVQSLKSHPKSVLFTATESGVLQWQGLLKNQLIALESMVTFAADEFSLDAGLVESRFMESGAATPKKPRKTPRRGNRTADIESLKKELIKQLRAARDHAFAKLDATGSPELLQCLTQEQLGKLVGLRKDTVTRCFQDDEGGELRILWSLANDPHRLLNWKDTNSN